MFNPGFGEPYTKEFYVVQKQADVNGLSNLFPGTLFGILIGSSSTEVTHSRSVYTIMTFLANVGGLNDRLIILGNFLIGSFSQVALINTLIAKLFYKKPQEVNFSLDDQSEESTLSALRHVSSYTLTEPFPFIMLYLQKYLCCPRFSSRKKLMTKAKSKLTQHLDIVKLIKRSIAFDSIFSVNYTKVERNLARRNYRARVIDP